MSLEIGLILCLCFMVALLLQQRRQQRIHTRTTQQNERFLLLLQSYPVHEYTLSHMLERCLVMLFAAPQLHLLAQQGVCFIQEHGKLKLEAQRGIHPLLSQNSDLYRYLYQLAKDTTVAQFVKQPEQHFAPIAESRGYYVLPLVRQEKVLAVFILVAANKAQAGHELKFIEAITSTLAKLVERKLFSDELRQGNSVMELSHQAIFITDKDNNITRCNQACEDIKGYSQTELLGKNPKLFKSDRHPDSFYQSLWHAVNTQGFWQGEIWNQHKNGNVYPEWMTLSAIKDINGILIQYVAIFTDLSSVKQSEQKIEQLSYFDSLTQLANRTLFNDRLQQAIVLAERQKSRCTLLCLDIDHFKKINDALGHAVGDKLLQHVAKRLANSLRKVDSIARLDGDEFAILLNEKEQYQVAHVIKKILHNLQQPIVLEGHPIIVTASIGVSSYPNDAQNASDLFKYADIALAQTKQSGRNGYQFYTQEFSQQTLQQLKIEAALRLALAEDDFEIFLQPQLDLATQDLIGAEALLRVKHGDLQGLSPAEYIPIAEETGLIIEIGDWVFEESCRQLASWHQQQLLPASFKRLAVNISPSQFNHPEFIEKIEYCLTHYAVPVKHLEIELTESSLQESNHSVVDKLLAIKRLGVTIAIDDFGTGYSSLSRLKQFPIDLLKIDRSFVMDICSNSSDLAIIKAIISMADALEIDTLAEGIEQHEQLTLLNGLDCDYGQGFLFDKPMNTEQFRKSLH